MSAGFSNTVLKAKSCGRPAAAAPLRGIPDIVHSDVTGLLVPPGDSHALRDAIAQLLEDENMRAEMSRKCRRIAVEEYAQAKQVQRYVELYERILSRNQNYSASTSV